MAGYSGTPLPRKLGIKPGARVGLIRPPDDFAETLGELPQGATAKPLGRVGQFDVIVCFCRNTKELLRDLPGLPARLDPAGGLWIAWPKRSSGMATDLGEGEVRGRGLGTGLVDNKVCAIDDTWSGLRFVIRLADRNRGNPGRVPTPSRDGPHATPGGRTRPGTPRRAKPGSVRAIAPKE